MREPYLYSTTFKAWTRVYGHGCVTQVELERYVGMFPGMILHDPDLPLPPPPELTAEQRAEEERIERIKNLDDDSKALIREALKDFLNEK